MAPEVAPIEQSRVVRCIKVIARILAALFVTFVFLTSVKILGTGFEMFGEGAVSGLIETAENPFVGLFVGVLVTSVLQSSSATTSMLVALVSAGTIGVRAAIPVVMGANIGTTVTNTIVAMGHVTRPREFRKAISCSTMHDFFNMLCVAVLLPIELATHFLEKSAIWLTGVLGRCVVVILKILGADTASGGGKINLPKSPLKVMMSPIVKFLETRCAGLPGHWGAVVMAAVGVVVLFVSLYFLTRILKTLLLGKVETALGGYLDKHGPVGILIGAGATAAVQSSSVTTSFMVPLAAAGVLKPRQIYPVVLGANVGTTITALLATLVGNAAGLALALTHLLFNLTGILIFYPIPAMRWPVWLGSRFGKFAAKRRVLALVYVAMAFYGLPLLLMFLGRRFF